MSIFLGKPDPEPRQSYAFGVASLGDIFAAGRDQLIYVENTYAAEAAIEQAYEDRNKEILKATGVRLENPYNASPEELQRSTRERRFSGSHGFKNWRDRLIREWDQKATEAVANIPDRTVADRLLRSIDGDATRIAREKDERLATVLESRGGIMKYGALLAGGLVGSLYDPLNVASMVFGGGPGAARTVAGRILTVAAKEALINGASEAAMQPMVQAWREKVGLKHGIDTAAKNVLFASAIGGVFGSAGQGIAEAARGIGRGGGRVPSADAGDMRIRADRGSESRAASLAEIRAALPPEARGALDAVDQLDYLRTSRPPAASPEFHERVAAAADRAVQVPGARFDFDIDQAQVDRVVDRLTGPVEARPPREDAPSLIPFLIARGGIQDFQGELAHIGATGVSIPFKGRLVKDSGSTLDYAREAAAEAGYFDAKFGDPETAVEKSTVADLLDAISEEARGNRVLPAGETVASGVDVEAARASVETLVSDIARMAGPAVDDDVIARAAEISAGEGLDPADALERALGGTDIVPIRAAVSRPDRSGGIDDPAHFDDDFAVSESDLAEAEALSGGEALPFFDDEPDMTIADFRQHMATADNLAAVVAACRA